MTKTEAKPRIHMVPGTRVTPLPARLESALDKVAAALHHHDPVARVHEARKALKAYRALLRLIRTPEAGEQRRAAAAIARRLAGDRDRQAARDALQVLVSRGDLTEADAREVSDCLEASGDPSDSEEQRHTLRAWVQQARQRHADTLDRQAASVDLVEEFTRGYRKARDHADLSTPDALHELRKRVVTHRYQMSFLFDLTGKGARRVRKAQALREILGSIQDVETLRLGLRGASGVGAVLLGSVERGIVGAQRDLGRRARVLQAGLFRRSSKVFRGRVGDWLDAVE